MSRKITLALALVFQASLSHAAGDVMAGKRAFAKCASCHQLGPSARAAFGPQLNGIVGRPAGSTPDYRYSNAMKNSGIVWTEARLRAFLKAPGDVVPGSKMRFFGIGSEREISDLLAYLRTFRPEQED
jgi:cytochrome c